MQSVLALGDLSPKAQAFASRVDRVRHAFGEDLCGDLGPALESADESESVLSLARLARLPLDFLLTTAPSLLSSCSQSLTRCYVS